MSDYDDSPDMEIASLIERLRHRLVISGAIHAGEDAVLIQAGKRLSGIHMTGRSSKEFVDTRCQFQKCKNRAVCIMSGHTCAAVVNLNSQIGFEKEEVDEIKRLLNRRTRDSSELSLDFTEHPLQFKVLRKLGAFHFNCDMVVDSTKGMAGYCGGKVIWMTNPYSDKAVALFQKIARDAGEEDGDYCSIDGEKALENYFGEGHFTIMEPTFRCEEHIGKLKEIAIQI